MGEAGQLTASALWDLSCPDWQARMASGRAPIPDLPLDRARADKAVDVFKRLRIFNVPGQPSFGEAAPPFIFDIVAAIFGAFDQATGERMIRGYFELIPKKNAKTTYGAGILMTAAILNKRPRARMVFTGPSQTVAREAYEQAKGMIALDREGYLQKRFHVKDHEQTIVDQVVRATEISIQTFSAGIVTGSVPSVVLIDEIHLLGKIPRAAFIIQQLTGGMVSIPEAFWMKITTQSGEPPAGVFKDDLKVARGIRDGTIKDVDTLPILYEFTEKQQKDPTFWREPKNWPLVNPNHGRSTFIPRLVKDLAEKREKGEAEVRIWFSQHANIEVGLGLHSDRWGGADYWEAAAEPGLTLEKLLERSEVVVLGIDGGGLDDLLGVAVIGRERGSDRMLLWNRAWCHEIALERRKEIAPILLDLEKAGEITIIREADGMSAEEFDQDIAELQELVEQLVGSGLMPDKNAVGVDPAGLDEIPNLLRRAGIDVEPGQQMVGISQGWKMTTAIDSAERALKAGKLRHAGQGLMAFCVGNAKVEPRGDAKVITKQAAGRAKIDPLKATFNAVSLMSLNPRATGSIYEDVKAYAAAFGGDDTAAGGDDWDPAILADPDHPQFVEHRQRFEAWQELQDED
jgi:phage terminase large subunit-like protein